MSLPSQVCDLVCCLFVCFHICVFFVFIFVFLFVFIFVFCLFSYLCSQNLHPPPKSMGNLDQVKSKVTKIAQDTHNLSQINYHLSFGGVQ